MEQDLQESKQDSQPTVAKHGTRTDMKCPTATHTTQNIDKDYWKLSATGEYYGASRQECLEVGYSEIIANTFGYSKKYAQASLKHQIEDGFVVVSDKDRDQILECAKDIVKQIIAYCIPQPVKIIHITVTGTGFHVDLLLRKTISR